ncbi:hypothetical protein [Planifilum fimeticola]|nr:hypothetical protein [Planifilum fimeticola]
MLTALEVSNDRSAKAVKICTDKIKAWRTGQASFESAMDAFLRSNSKADGTPVQFSSLANYTRFTLAVIRDVGWFEVKTAKELPHNVRQEYVTELGPSKARHVQVNTLTNAGREELTRVSTLKDIRWQDLQGADEKDLAWLVVLFMASKACREIDATLAAKLDRGASVLRNLGVKVDTVRSGKLKPLPILFEPSQQLPSRVLLHAEKLVR